MAAITAGLVASAPAVAATIVNADQVDGYSAVGCHKSESQRAGKLVATCPSGFLPNNIIRRAPNSLLLNGRPSSSFYLKGTKVADSNLLDGKDSTAFYAAGSKVADSDLLDGKDSTAFLAATGKAVDADKLDGIDSTAFLQGATSSARSSACSGSQFYPVVSTDVYGTSGSLRTSGTNPAEFRCSADLPQGATVTSVAFSLADPSATDSVSACKLVRTNLASSIGTESTMAGPVGTTAVAIPGNTRVSTSSITNPAIDNSSFSYYLTCTVNSTASTVGIYGASVSYTITNTNG